MNGHSSPHFTFSCIVLQAGELESQSNYVHAQPLTSLSLGKGWSISYQPPVFYRELAQFSIYSGDLRVWIVKYFSFARISGKEGET